MVKDAHYFSHDTDARNDPKIKKLLMKMGIEGYGIYWWIVELLYEQGGFLMLDDCESIAFDMRLQCERIENVINNYKLFKKDNERFWSESVLDRIKIREEKAEKAAKSAEIRWQNNANAMRTHSDGNAINKGNKSNQIKERDFIPPSLEEVKNYFDEKGYSEKAALTAYEYYSAHDWIDSKGNEVKSWKAKMISVWFKPEHAKSATIVDLRTKPIDHRNNPDIESWRNQS